MRITISIDDKDLKEVMRLTKARSKSAAVNTAVSRFLRMQKLDHIQRMVREGKVNYTTTNDQIEAMWDDPR